MQTTRSPFPYIMKLPGLLLFIIFYLFVANALFGQQYKGKPFVLNFDDTEYRTDDQNWSIDITKQGIVYIGNNNGLLEFDGSNWNLYPMPEGMVIRSVCTEGDSIVYVGAYEEFGYWKRNDKGNMSYHSLSDTLKQKYFHNDEIWRIIRHNQKVYFQSFSTIYVYNGKNINVIHPSKTIVLLMKARDRLFIHMVGEGLYEVKNDSLNFVEGSGILADDEIKVVLPYREDDFLVGAAQNGMYVYNGNEFIPWEKPVNKTIRNSEVNVGVATDDLLIIGTVVNGIFIFDQHGNLKDHLHAGNYLQNSTVLALSKDKRNNLWVGLDKGLHYVNLNSVLEFYVNPAKNTGSVYTAEIIDDKLLVGTNQGLFRYNFDSLKGYTNPTMIRGSQGQVWDIQKVNGEVVCGHNNGTYMLEGNRLVKISEINGGFEMKEININNQQKFLQSTYSVLAIYDKTTEGLQFSHTIEGVLEPMPDFETDHREYIWAAHTHKRIYRIALNQGLDSVANIKQYGKDEGFHNERKIRVAKIDNRIVFSTGKLLYTYDDLNDTIIPYESLNRKLGRFKEARNMIEAKENHYWFIKGHEIALFEIRNSQVIRKFYYDLPKLDMYLTSNFPNIVTLSDSLHLICLDKGFAIFNENRVIQDPDSTEILMRKVTAGSQKDQIRYLPLESKQPVEVDFPYRNLGFTFSNPQYFHQSEFRYKLKGMNNQWSEWQNDSKIDFIRLPAGKYEFLVQSKNIGGEVSKPLSYQFTIQPPWYASRTAWFIYTGLFIGALIILRKIFRKRIELHKKKVEEEEKQKREQEKLREEQKYIRLRNEKLQNDISHKSSQLANYTMTIIRKNELLVNIRNELEHQKKELGSRFPDYYYRRLLKMIDRGISSEEEWEKFEYHFDQAHSSFFKRLKQQYPELTQADLKLCAYLRLNLTSKEIAPLLNITIRGVEVRRYRLRKRLSLDTDENLVEFLLNF